METKSEFAFSGSALNGFMMLFVNLAILILAIVGIVYGIIVLDAHYGDNGGWLLGGGILLLLINLICWCGFLLLEPNEARVLTWFGKYSGTFTRTGFFWVNPFCTAFNPAAGTRLEQSGDAAGSKKASSPNSS